MGRFNPYAGTALENPSVPVIGTSAKAQEVWRHYAAQAQTSRFPSGKPAPKNDFNRNTDFFCPTAHASAAAEVLSRAGARAKEARNGLGPK
jgi:hypothetical protein